MADNDYSDFRSPAALQAGLRMWEIFPPILMIVGTMGNVLSICVLSRRTMNKTTYSVYLMALATADQGMLCIGLLRQWIKFTFDVDIRTLVSAVCKLHIWLVYTNSDICAWILTIITIERLVSTLSPNKRKRFCSRRKAKIYIGCLVTLALAVNSHLLYGFTRQEMTSNTNITTFECAPMTNSYAVFYRKVWSWMDLCKASLLPFVILSVGNACIIWKLVESSKRSKGVVTRSRFNMSRLLVIINFVFIVCTAPVCIYFIGDGYWIPEDVPMKVKNHDPLWAAVNLFLYSNNAVNFFLYCLSGSKFRKELKNMFLEIADKSKKLTMSELSTFSTN